MGFLNHQQYEDMFKWTNLYRLTYIHIQYPVIFYGYFCTFILYTPHPSPKKKKSTAFNTKYFQTNRKNPPKPRKIDRNSLGLVIYDFHILTKKNTVSMPTWHFHPKKTRFRVFLTPETLGAIRLLSDANFYQDLLKSTPSLGVFLVTWPSRKQMDLETVKIEGLYRGCCKFCFGLRVGGLWRVGFWKPSFFKHFIPSSPMKKQRSCFHQKGQLTFKRGCRFHEHLFDVFPHVAVLAHPYQQNSWNKTEKKKHPGPFEVTFSGEIK